MRITFTVAAAVGALAITGPAWAQNTLVPPTPIEKMTSLPVVVRAAADALGMVRGLPQFETMKAINRIEFSGAGKMWDVEPGGAFTPYTVSKYVGGLSYHLPAARIDITRAKAGSKDSERVIRVFKGDVAWNEKTPGVGHTPAPGVAAERLAELQVTPHGFMSAVVRAKPEDLSFANVGGKIVITVKVNGVAWTGTLNDKNQVVQVVIPVKHPVLGDTTLEGVYAEYKDIDDYTVMFPTKFQNRLAGKPILDLTVTGFATAPYIVFPVPPGVAAK